MVKVCHMTSVHTRYDIRIVQKQCVSLARGGYDVYLAVCDAKKDEEYKGIHIVSTGFETQSRFERFWKSGNAVYKIAKKIDADIYCLHDPELLRYAKRFYKEGKKVIFDSHEFYAFQILTKGYIPSFMRKSIAFCYQAVERYCFKYVHAVLVPCTIDGKNYFADKARETVYISNVPRLSEFYEAYNEDLKKENLICHIGSLTYERGILHLIKAMEQIDARLVLAGDYSPDSFESELKQLAGYRKVDYLGYLSREDVKNIYNKAKIGICTMLNVGQYSHVDNLATKVYEYMSMGLPVVLSDTLYTRQLLKKYPFGIAVRPEDTGEIAEAVNYILSNPEEAAKMGEMGRRAVKDMFNWEIEEQKLLQLYEKLEK